MNRPTGGSNDGRAETPTRLGEASNDPPPSSKDQLTKLITEVLGERCPSHHVDCMTCAAWWMLDRLPVETTTELYEIAREVATMDCFYSGDTHESDCKCLVGRAERATNPGSALKTGAPLEDTIAEVERDVQAALPEKCEHGIPRQFCTALHKDQP